MKKVVISGASDDLVYVKGDIHEEFHPGFGNEEPHYLAFSDGTLLEILYSEKTNGIWRINRLQEGTARYEKIEGTDPDGDYSDRVTLTGDLLWVMFGDAIARAKK